MSDATALMLALLAGRITDAAGARAQLETAIGLEVDPLDHVALQFGLSSAEVMARAADWAGLAFAETIPRLVQGSTQISRLDAMSEVRAVRARLLGREVVFAAPRFAQFLSLRTHADGDPSFRRRLCVVPPAAIRANLAQASEGLLLDAARHRLSQRWPSASGHRDLVPLRRAAFVAAILAVVGLAALSPFVLRPVLVPLVSVILIAPAALRLWAALSPPACEPAPTLLADAELPVYSVLIPLRDEAHMVDQLAEAMRAIDYPPAKLDIKFVVEARSPQTVDAVRRTLGDPRFELVVVPEALPATKPKALNYALPLVRGEHVVIYDAEDIPDPVQLRLAASRFSAQPEIDCLQAELVIDNAGENALTALFAGEYAGQFGLMLPLLARLRLPMPLGGTSNHFRVAALREVGGWDAYNVTEDADLGVRLSRLLCSEGTGGGGEGRDLAGLRGIWWRRAGSGGGGPDAGRRCACGGTGLFGVRVERRPVRAAVVRPSSSPHGFRGTRGDGPTSDRCRGSNGLPSAAAGARCGRSAGRATRPRHRWWP